MKVKRLEKRKFRKPTANSPFNVVYRSFTADIILHVIHVAVSFQILIIISERLSEAVWLILICT